MQLKCGGIFNNCVIASFPECISERIFKTSQYLAKIWTNVWQHFFMAHSEHGNLPPFLRSHPNRPQNWSCQSIHLSLLGYGLLTRKQWGHKNAKIGAK